MVQADLSICVCVCVYFCVFLTYSFRSCSFCRQYDCGWLCEKCRFWNDPLLLCTVASGLLWRTVILSAII